MQEPDPYTPSLPATIMPPGNRRHIPIAIKELMIILQTRNRMKKARIADLLDVDPRTVRRVTKLEAETGSVVREPIVKGPHWMLNGIDCAVRCNYFICNDACILNSYESISNRFWKEHQISICVNSRKTLSQIVACMCHLAQSRGHSSGEASPARSWRSQQENRTRKHGLNI